MRLSQFHSGLLSFVDTQPSVSDSLKIRRRSSIPPSLQSYECPFNWLELHPGYPFSLAEFAHGILILEEKFRDEAQEIKYGDWVKSSFEGIALIARKFTQVYFNTECQNFHQANECLQEAEAFIRKWSGGNPNPDYVQGFLYILEGLDIYRKIQINLTSKSGGNVRRSGGFGMGLAFHVDGLKTFSRLTAKAKYIIWTVRDVFLIYCSRAVVNRTDWMETILLEMEPYVPKWHFYLYRALHGRRKVVRRPLPLLLLDDDESYEDEADIGRRNPQANKIGGAAAAGVVDDDPLSISYQCLCLAQMFTEMERRNIGKTGEKGRPTDYNDTTDAAFGETTNGQQKQSLNQYYPWRFGQHTFETPAQVLECLLEKTINVLEMECHLDGVYLNLSEVHMFVLPLENRSTELAVRCLKKALRLNAANPKTHYRMGLAQFKLTNHKQAADHFREAIRGNPNNIGAIFGLIQLLMTAPVENSVEIQSIFKCTMRNLDLIRVWDKRCLRTLHYLKGCFYFMLQENKQDTGGSGGGGGEVDYLNEAITSWIIAHGNESPKWSYYFLNLAHQSSRFQWPTKKLNLHNVSNALKHVAYLEQTQFRQLLLDICSEVDDALRRSSSKRNSSNAFTTSTT